jgi:putative aldouronate transport system substrate-binding protein
MNLKLVLVVSLFFVLFGCSEPEQSKADPVTFSVLYNDVARSPFRSDWLILEEYSSRKNVLLDVQLADDGAYDLAVAQVFELGSAPDIILKCWPDQVKNYASEGLLLPFSDYEYLMPNFINFIESHSLQQELDKLRLDNGKYYILPGYKREIQVQQWIYRRDLFAQNNLTQPETYDQLYEHLLFLKERYPNSTPITACWSGAHLLAMMGAGYGIPAGWAGMRHYDAEEDSWRFSPATENYRELYSFLNRCYTAGLLDPDLFTQDEATFINKLVDGSAFVTVTWVTSGFANWNDQLQENGIVGGEWAALPVMKSTIGIKALPPVDPFNKGLVVSSAVVDQSYFEDLLKFLDWAVYSDEGMTLTTWGVEGLTYKNTETGKAFMPDIKTPHNPDGALDSTMEYGLHRFFDLNENWEFEDYKKPPEIKEFLARSQAAGEAAAMDPILKLSAQEMSAANIIIDNLSPFVDDISYKFITGELDIDDYWDSYLSELEQVGYLTLETIWNNAWLTQKRALQ